MVMRQNIIILFIGKDTERIEKTLADFADPLSKPAHVHEYEITFKSLVRANALRYTLE